MRDRAHGVRALRARRGEARLAALPRSAHAIAKDVGLQPLDVGKAIDELVDRAVGRGIASPRSSDVAMRRPLGLDVDRLAVRRRSGTAAPAASRRRRAAARCPRRRAAAVLARPDGVAQPRARRRRWRCRGRVGDRELAQDQPLEHRLVDDAAGQSPRRRAAALARRRGSPARSGRDRRRRSRRSRPSRPASCRRASARSRAAPRR